MSRSIQIGPPPAGQQRTANISDALGLTDAVSATSGGYPDSTNTGYAAAGYTPTTATKTTFTSADSGTAGAYTVVTGKRFPDTVYLDDNTAYVRFVGCDFVNDNADIGAIRTSSNGNVHHIEFIDSTVRNGGSTSRTGQYGFGAWGHDWLIQRCLVKNFADHCSLNGPNITIRDSLFTGVTYQSGDHCDLITFNEGVSGITVQHNTLEMIAATNGQPMTQTACLSLFQDFGTAAYTNVLVDDNLVIGPKDGGIAFYCGYEPYKGGGKVSGSNVRFTNNKFRGVFATNGLGFSAEPTWGASGNVKSGNVWYDGPLVGQTVS